MKKEKVYTESQIIKAIEKANIKKAYEGGYDVEMCLGFFLQKLRTGPSYRTDRKNKRKDSRDE